MVYLETERLLLRDWRDDDRPAFAAMNADPRVMEHFESVLSREESNAAAARFQASIEADGFGFYAVEVKGGVPFVGAVGVKRVTFDAPFTPAVETGWRLGFESWGLGYATEAARACLDHAFGPLGLREVVAFTALENVRSMKVMERIGMTRDLDGDFDHPRVTDGHRLQRHALYRARQPGTG